MANSAPEEGETKERRTRRAITVRRIELPHGGYCPPPKREGTFPALLFLPL